MDTPVVVFEALDGKPVEVPKGSHPKVLQEGSAAPQIRPFGLFGSFRRPYCFLVYDGAKNGILVLGTKAAVEAKLK